MDKENELGTFHSESHDDIIDLPVIRDGAHGQQIEPEDQYMDVKDEPSF
jgi:hypothetical protein